NLALSGDGQTLATGAFESGRATFRRIVKQGDSSVTLLELFPLEGHEAMVRSLAFSRDGKLILSTASDQTVRLWDQLTGKELHRFHGGSLPHAVFSPDGSRLAYIDVNHQIERVIFLIETAGGKVIGKIKSPAQLNSLALSADNRTVICSSYDKKIYVMEQAT